MAGSLRLLSSVAVVSLAVACASSRATLARPDEPPPLLQLSENVSPEQYRLDVSIDPGLSSMRGTVAIDVAVRSPTTTIWLHGRELRVFEAYVTFGDERLTAKYEQVDPLGVSRLVLPRAVGPGHAVLQLQWEAGWSMPWDGIFRTKHEDLTYVATQFEPIAARTAFPCFDDPMFKTAFDVTLTVPAGAAVFTNTAPVEEIQTAGGRKRVRFARTAPLPTYLLFWAVGPYDVADGTLLPSNDLRSVPLPTRVIVPRGRAREAAFLARAAAELTPPLERWFGTAFPYQKLDHVVVADFTEAAMENAGAIAYGALTLEPEGGFSTRERMSVADTVAHETAHQWFGDLVTPRWWSDLWLNEAFATWMASAILREQHPEWRSDLLLARSALRAQELEGLASGRAVREPLTSLAEVNDLFDATTYYKGARVLGMVEHLIGPDRFRQGIRSYVAERAHGTGSTPDVVAALSRAAGRPLESIFSSFLDEPGMPLVAVKIACGAGGPRLELQQTRWLPRGSRAHAGATWSVPVCARYSVGGAVHERCTVLNERAGELRTPEGCPEWVMPDAGGAGWYYWALPAPELAALRAAAGRLAASEKLSVARSVWGAQRAGVLPFGEAFTMLLGLAGDPDPLVAASPINALLHARDRLASEEARPAVEDALRRAYRPVLARVGWEAAPGETPYTAELRAGTIDLLVHAARDPEVSREAARRGRAYATPGQPLDRRAVPADLAKVALSAAVAEGDAAFWDSLHSRLGTAAPAERPRIVEALALATGAASARATALWRDPALALQERWQVLRAQAAHRETRPRTFATLEGDAEALLETQSEFFRTFVPALLDTGCTRGEAQRAATAFARVLPRWPGLRRAADEAVELIEVCAAEREAESGALEAFFAAAASSPASPAVR